MASFFEATATHETFTPEEKHAIELQLERLLTNPHFSNSRRFPSFLRYIVTATINGQADLLKERTLGVEIFGKTPDYDTASDPIVRVTAAEIRKRIAQYYQDAGHENELRLSLSPGSYVPQFHLPLTGPATREVGIEDVAASHVVAATTHALAPARSTSRRRWILLGAMGAVLIAILAAFIGWRQSQRSAFAQFWDPVLNSTEPVLFCVADQTQYTAISLRDAADPERQVTLNDNLTAVVIDDLSTIIKIAGVLHSAGKPYTLRGENATTLMDLRNGPSVMIGAFDNAWTLRMLRPLRYHFANNSDMTMFSIVDGSQAGQARWVVDRRLQIATNNYRDYAIVARFTDDTTGKPTLVAAGIGRGGTIAAGEFLTDHDLLKAVRDQRPSTKANNVEVVLSTQIIDGEPGTPKIEAVYFW
jgi:hypothetical protein